MAGGLRNGSLRDDDGQSIVELALTLPLLILLAFGLVEVGSVLNSYMTVTTSAREAARLGVRAFPDDQLVDLAIEQVERLSNAVPPTCSPGAPGVCVGHPTVGGAPAVSVEVCYPHDPVIGIPGVAIGSMTMCSSTTMRVLEGSP